MMIQQFTLLEAIGVQEELREAQILETALQKVADAELRLPSSAGRQRKSSWQLNAKKLISRQPLAQAAATCGFTRMHHSCCSRASANLRLPREFLVANGAFQLAVEKITRRLCRMGEAFRDAQFEFPNRAGLDDLLPLAVPSPVDANDAVRLTFHYGNSNSKLNGFPAPVASNSEMNVIASGGRGMKAFRCVTG